MGKSNNSYFTTMTSDSEFSLIFPIIFSIIFTRFFISLFVVILIFTYETLRNDFELVLNALTDVWNDQSKKTTKKWLIIYF